MRVAVFEGSKNKLLMAMGVKYVIIAGEGFITRSMIMTGLYAEAVVEQLLRDKLVDEEDAVVLYGMLAKSELPEDHFDVFHGIMNVQTHEDFVSSIELKIYEGQMAVGFNVGDDPQKSCQIYDKDGGAELSKKIFNLEHGLNECSELVRVGNVHALDGVLIMQAMIKAGLPKDKEAQLKAYETMNPRLRRAFERRHPQDLLYEIKRMMFGGDHPRCHGNCDDHD